MGDWWALLARILARRRVALGFVAAVAMLVVARPTWESWRAGLLVALAGECLRLWAAGHLEKSREVTRSGPYRLMRHPLYAGSMAIALGVAIAARGAVPALLAGFYMGLTILAAIHVEESHLRQTFGTTYDEYRESRAEPMVRRFSLARALRNREHRALIGLVLGFALLALKILAPL
jgi:protein-S-isoprenylcysteine O-methyltransferase Ste14